MNRFLIATLLLLGGLLEPSLAQDGDSQKAVLITGASSGIGRNMAETLAREGYFVYAGARESKQTSKRFPLSRISRAFASTLRSRKRSMPP